MTTNFLRAYFYKKKRKLKKLILQIVCKRYSNFEVGFASLGHKYTHTRPYKQHKTILEMCARAHYASVKSN